MWQYQNTDELYHHGVIGMKWGIRRYQNKDGSLTPAGRKRADKLLGEYAKITGKKVVVKKGKVVQTHAKKTVKDMTNEELDAKIRRKEKENRYNQLYPEKVSIGKRFVNSLGKDVLVPGMQNAGRNLVTNILTDFGNSIIKKSKNKD